MPMQNRQALPSCFSERTQSFAQIEFFGSIELRTESGDLAEGFRFAENKRTGAPLANAARPVPQRNKKGHAEKKFVQLRGHAATNEFSTRHRVSGFREQFA